MKKKIISIIEILLVIILMTSLYRIYNYNKNDKAFKSATREVQEKFEREEVKTSDSKIDEEENRNGEAIKRIEDLRKDYPSVVAWIRVGGTDIDYPIVKGSDNDYYLNHNYKDEYNIFGAIFMDYRNKEDFSDQNTIIYGHNNARAGNFKDLHKYEEEGFFNEDRFIEIYSLDGYKKYKVFAVYNADPYDKFRSPSYTGEEGKNLLAYIKERNLLDGDIPEEIKDILTLQTCSPGDTRLVVQGVLVED
ncbi:MAG: class B sortase [Peptoniphilus harei]|uniref:class B sortase n=1 Tax=Peptoniphilus harei TaxID=54005 RepID=UPI00254E5A26|nr:class B sortase [Peptoniphilus harei]MDK7754587.1 class B sortase [Peptoniphilus harei]MDK7760393.1 class B sortase [Peptoniphilus harei]MDK8270183.1 class B sortase [Peptoniphilus harei]MDK8338643.1 class B sortase [Peptoniphilus harei]